jgi:hypothetical protein
MITSGAIWLINYTNDFLINKKNQWKKLSAREK